MRDKKLPPDLKNQPLPRGADTRASAVEAFVRQARALAPKRAGEGAGRLILALDATMSRQATWDLACSIQAEMFDAVGKKDSLNVQLVYYRGFGECRSSKFVSDTTTLKNLMTRIDCRGGQTQIGKVFAHALREHAREKVNAVVFIGDAMEENVDLLAQKAGEMGLKGVPLFIFQEGHDGAVTTAFKEFARLSKGAWFRFDRNAAGELARLLSSVAVYASGGLRALEARNKPEDRLMLEHLGRKPG